MSTNLSFNNTRNGYGLVSIAFHWLAPSAKGEPIPFFGVELPAAAAIYHHYSMRDNTLRLMLPLQRP